MEAGHIALVSYGERPVVWHTRILLAHVHGSCWIILTPDHDRYEEQLDAANPDYEDFEFLGPNHAIPARIPQASIYGFAPMDPGELARQMALGRIEADSIRAQRGLPPLAGGRQGVAAPAPVPAAPVPAPPPSGVLGPAAGPVAAAAPAVGVADPYCWVTLESGAGRLKGDVVVVEPNPLPAGTQQLGDRAMLQDPAQPGHGIFLKRVLQSQSSTYKLDDFRVLPVQFDAQGVRRRDFHSAVPIMIEGSPAGGGLQLEGPATALNIAKGLRDQNLTPTTYHEFWIRTGEIPKGDRSVYEHECLSRIFEAMVTIDQLNPSGLQSAELVVRRMQVIREAHRISPTSPDYSSADIFMGWRYRKQTQGVDSSLAAYVAVELKSDAAIAKESRKAREEQQQRRRNLPKGGGDSAVPDPNRWRELFPLPAIEELLHHEVAYTGETCATTVRPYDRSLVSLPDCGSKLVPLDQVLDAAGREVVGDPHGRMLVSEAEWGEIVEKGETVMPYMDVTLQKCPELYHQFILDLYEKNLISFTSKPQGLVTPFFVAKKNGRLRFILDCRAVNRRFHPPPPLAMAAGSTWSSLDLPQGEILYTAQSDIRDYFYSLELPTSLQPLFCLPAIPHRLLQAWGVDERHFSEPDGQGWVFPHLVAVPMGWNWAMWLSQRAHQQIALEASGLGVDRVLVEGKPCPELASGKPVIIPYADNLNVTGINAELVQQTKDVVVKRLRELGFRVHEELDAHHTCQSLGFLIDGLNGTVSPIPERLDKICKAFMWLSRRPQVSGRSIERLLGHAVHICLLRRELLSIFRGLYDFAYSCYDRRAKLWPVAAKEARWAANLLKLCQADLKKTWSRQVTSSDASLSGIAVCKRDMEPAEQSIIGGIKEHWRYKSRIPVNPREAALSPLDPFSNPETVKPSEVQKQDPFELNEVFPEVPKKHLQKDLWHDVFAVHMTHPEHISLLEGRGVVAALRHKFRSSFEFNRKHLHFSDNLAVALLAARGRSNNFQMLRVSRRIAALLLATGSWLSVRWIPSEYNVADRASRQWEHLRDSHVASRGAVEKGKKEIHARCYNKLGLTKDQKISSRRAKMQTRVDPPRFWGQTMLEKVAVSQPVALDYQRRVKELKQYAKKQRLSLKGATNFDQACCKFVNHMFNQGFDLQDGSKTLAAIMDAFPAFSPKHMLSRTRRALQGWGKLEPQQTRPPVPWLLIQAISMELLKKNKKASAAAILLMFTAYLRPGEALDVQRRDLVPPLPGSKHYSLHLHPAERAQQSKVGLSDESILLDSPVLPWIGRWAADSSVRRYEAHARPQDFSASDEWSESAARCVEIAQAALARAASNHSIRSLSSVGARTPKTPVTPRTPKTPNNSFFAPTGAVAGYATTFAAAARTEESLPSLGPSEPNSPERHAHGSLRYHSDLPILLGQAVGNSESAQIFRCIIMYDNVNKTFKKHK
ncbi:unnamed protein product [Cladocopium goreaui]|uniref:Ankyrin-1 n=1 Tax=Cladocopium goreaui TaxID=2562237 RepID=A0A9P1D0S6_9DINO|nr:unnamed protein product [Cladocopium goreaui]